MIKIGLTGGIGSGKSYVAKVFKHMGVPVFNTDLEARSLTDDEKIIDKLKAIFGEIIYDDKIGCSEEYKKFSRELLMSRYNLESDQVVFRCDTIVDHKGVNYTKRYKEIKIILL